MRLLLQEAALELYLERGYDKTTAGDIAARAGFTERTFFRHFADKREVFFGGEAQLRDLLTGAVAAVPAGTRPLPALRAAFRQAVPLIERNLPVTERRMPVIVATPALQERALAKSAALVAALAEALRAAASPSRSRPCAPRWHGHLRDPGIPLDVRTAGALLLLYGQFVSRLARLTAADIEQHGPDASPHGLWAPALQRMQHFELARDWKPCPRRLSLDPVTGEATA